MDAASSTAMVREETVPAASHAQRGHAGEDAASYGVEMDLSTCIARSTAPSPAPSPESAMIGELRDLNEVLRQPDPAVDDPTRLDERDMDYPKGVGGEEEKNGAFETMADFHDWSASYSTGPDTGPDLSKISQKTKT